jgi:hypothetical protein
MNDLHKLPDGVEIVVRLYLVSDKEGVDAVPTATYRGGMPAVSDLPANWREQAAHLRMGVGMLDTLASDWRPMTRDEVLAFKEDHPE